MELPQWHHRPHLKQKGVLDQDAFLLMVDILYLRVGTALWAFGTWL